MWPGPVRGGLIHGELGPACRFRFAFRFAAGEQSVGSLGAGAGGGQDGPGLHGGGAGTQMRLARLRHGGAALGQPGREGFHRAIVGIQRASGIALAEDCRFGAAQCRTGGFLGFQANGEAAAGAVTNLTTNTTTTLIISTNPPAPAAATTTNQPGTP